MDINLDEFPDGTASVLGAAMVAEDGVGHATRNEIQRIIGDIDYGKVKYRVEKLREAGVLNDNTVQTKTGVEHRYTVVDGYRDDAETLAAGLAYTGGDLTDEPGADAFWSVVDELADLEDRIDDLERGGEVVSADRVDDLEGHVRSLSRAVDDVRTAVVLLSARNDLTVVSNAKSALRDARYKPLYAGALDGDDVSDVTIDELD